jgi:hypothetical protein
MVSRVGTRWGYSLEIYFQQCSIMVNARTTSLWLEDRANDLAKAKEAEGMEE